MFHIRLARRGEPSASKLNIIRRRVVSRIAHRLACLTFAICRYRSDADERRARVRMRLRKLAVHGSQRARTERRRETNARLTTFTSDNVTWRDAMRHASSEHGGTCASYAYIPTLRISIDPRISHKRYFPAPIESTAQKLSPSSSRGKQRRLHELRPRRDISDGCAATRPTKPGVT